MTAIHDSTVSAKDEVRLPADRQLLCLEGVWELDKIARTLPSLVRRDDEQDDLIVRALAGRVLRITSMLMSALGDPAHETSELKNFIDFENGQG